MMALKISRRSSNSGEKEESNYPQQPMTINEKRTVATASESEMKRWRVSSQTK